MVPVFSRTPSKPCSKTMNRMVLAAAVAAALLSGAGRLAGAVWAPLIGFAGTAPR